MAAKKTKADNKSEQAGKPKKSFLVRRVLPLTFMLVALIFMPTTIIVLVGMLPTIVAFYVDNDRRKMGAFAMCFMNLAPVISYVLILWQRKHDMANALTLLMDPKTLIVIYFGCFIGWTLNKFIPPIVGEFLRRSGMKRLVQVEKEQKELLQAWGDDVRKTS